MGQYWEIFAYNRCETLGCWGKAGEFVPSAAPAEMIHRLVVPVVDVDSTGPRNPSPCDTSSNVLAGTGVAGASIGAPHHAASANSNICLLQLPNEIVSLIWAELDINSLYTLTHCCHILRYLLRPEVAARFRRTLAPWANTPLICAGDYMETNPPGINISYESFKGIDNCNQMSIYQLMGVVKVTNVRKACLAPPTLNPPNRKPRGYHAWDRILQLKQYFPVGRGWVLRNLTKQEYVYAHVLTSKDGNGGGIDKPVGEHAWGFNFGTLIAVRTCWSDDPSATMLGLDVRGAWAGHCFDIVVEDKLKEDTAHGRWMDVSFKAWQEMVRLFELNDWNIPWDSDEE